MFELVKNNRHLFWTYDLAKSQPTSVVVVEQLLKYGDVEDVQTLFSIFTYDEIVAVWKNTLQGIEQFKKQNAFLCAFFLKDQVLLGKKSISPRHERITKLAS